MKRFILLLLSVFLITSCAPAMQTAVAQSLPAITSTPLATTTPESKPTVISFPISPSPTATQTPCDPYSVDFCITDGHFIFRNPIFPPGNTSVDVAYRYGSTQNDTRDPHHGVEFLNKFGTSVHAAGDGVVQFAGPDKDASYSLWKNFYGNMIVIRHDNDLFTLYAHLSKINVQAGDQVKTGDLIGEVGQSGVATGSHLHFEVRRGSDGMDYFSTQNPELWLVPNMDEYGNLFGVISFSILDEKSKPQFAEFTVSYYLDKNGTATKPYYVTTYSKDMMTGDENAALGDLSPGYYRVVLKYNGQFHERWVEVESGKLTQVVFVAK